MWVSVWRRFCEAPSRRGLELFGGSFTPKTSLVFGAGSCGDNEMLSRTNPPLILIRETSCEQSTAGRIVRTYLVSRERILAAIVWNRSLRSAALEPTATSPDGCALL